MARTNSSSVEGILLDNYDGSSSLTPFIDTATDLVDAALACAVARGTTLSTTRLELIERWLAAHFYAIADPLYMEKKTEKASGKFQGKTEMGLDSTTYGQQAQTLDTSGCLSAMSEGKRTSVQWLGKAVSAQTDYRDRD